MSVCGKMVGTIWAREIMNDVHNRRAFLRAAAAAGAAWAAADVAQIEEALAWAARQVEAGGATSLSVLETAEASVIDAMTSRILPSVDGKPGAHEAGVVYFIDRALATFNADQKKLFAEGIANLNRRAARRWKGASFAALPPAQHDELLHAIEKTPFFKAVRLNTIVGTFALPAYG